MVALSASALVDEHVEGGRGRAGPGNFSKPEGPKAQEVSAAGKAERRGEWWGSGKENRERERGSNIFIVSEVRREERGWLLRIVLFTPGKSWLIVAGGGFANSIWPPPTSSYIS